MKERNTEEDNLRVCLLDLVQRAIPKIMIRRLQNLLL